MFTLGEWLLVYLIAMTGLVMLSYVNGEMRTIYRQCRSPIGFLIFLLAVYLSPPLIVLEAVDPGLLNELRPFIFKPGQFAPLPGVFHRTLRERRTDV